MRLLREVGRFYEGAVIRRCSRRVMDWHHPIDLRPEAGIICAGCKSHTPWPCSDFIEAHKDAEDNQ